MPTTTSTAPARKSVSTAGRYRDDVMKALELARAAKVIGKSLEAKVTVYGKEDNEEEREAYQEATAQLCCQLVVIYIINKV